MAENARYIYFNLRGRGELPRLVCAAGGLKLTEERISMADWPDFKSKCPFQQLPCLIVNGKWYAQKLAISLYFARQCGLYPTASNELELLEVDYALQYTEEILENIIQYLVDKIILNKPGITEELKNETLPQKLPRLENLLKQSGSGFYVGKKLSIVDLSAFDVIEHVIELMGKAYLDNFPLIKANFEKVGQVPEIKAYVATRPPSEEGMETI